MTVPTSPQRGTETTCYRHPDRRAGVSCQRCDRYICPQCMHSASVGFHCPECARSGRQKVIQGPQVFRGRPPVVTQALLGINLAVFVLNIVVSSGGAFDGLGRLGLDGALAGPLVANGEWYRVLTSGFLHIGVIHIAFNMMALYALGPGVEKAVGPLRFGLLYLLSLLGGSLAVLLVEPNAFTAGASGAIYGLLGVLVVAQRANGVNPWSSGIGGLLIFNLVLTITIPGISIGGHIGGLVAGALGAALVFEVGPRLADKRIVPFALGAACLVLFALSLAIA